MQEKEKKFSGSIRYTEGDLISGLERARGELEGLKQDAKSSDEITKDIARQSIPQYESAVQFGDQHSPAEMFTKLQAIFTRAQILEFGGASQIEIGRIIGQEFGEQISDLRVILRPTSGWIKSLGQWVYAAAIK